MIGIGTDIVAILRVEAVWRRQGPRFVRRILTPQERRSCAMQREPWRFLAKRFAAKEAIAKAMGTGIGAELSWQDIEIEKTAKGAPQVMLTPRAQALAERRGASRVLLSLSDEQAYAVAFAVLLA